MKTTFKVHINLLLMFLLMMCISGMEAFAQLPTQGTWGLGMEQNVNIETDTEVELTGDIDMTGVFVIKKGATLTITSRKNVTIKNTSIMEPKDKKTNQGRSRFFTVRGHLIIKGIDGARITMDGGADFTWDENNYALIKGPKSRKLQEMIANEGTLTLENVHITNVNGEDDQFKLNYLNNKNEKTRVGNTMGGAIYIYSASSADEDQNGPTILKNCVIEKCYAQLGSAIMIGGHNIEKFPQLTSENCKVELIDTEIRYCVSGNGDDSNSGGTIRTYGNTLSNLYLTRVNMHHNYARRNVNYNHQFSKDGNGGALFWNGRGSSDTKCVINGCRFEYNKCDDNGGAIKTQSSIQFVGSPTTLAYNKAPNGAGLYIEGYIGGVQLGAPRILTYDLDENLIIKDNTATSYSYKGTSYPGKGGGVHFFFGEDMDLEKGSTINVNLNGATIQDNITEDGGLGAGIYFEDTSKPEMNYIFNINLNHGTLNNNSGAQYGGGMYISNGTINSTESSEKMVIDGNKALVSGGGIYIGAGSYTMQTGDIKNNEVANGNGAGVYVGGDFTMTKGTIQNNKAQNGDGGGVYIENGNFTITESSTITSNIVGGNGGGAYVSNGNFTMSNGYITHNSTSTGHGAGVYMNGGNITFENGNISSNLALAGNGGGICLQNGSMKISAGTLESNTCKLYGGGVYVENGTFTMSNGNINENTTTEGHGGGIYIIGGGGFTMNNGNITNNKTIQGNGGGAYLDGGNFTFKTGQILANTAPSVTGNGGGICLMNGEVVIEGGTIQNNECGQYGGGLYVFDDTTGERKQATFSGGEIIENNARYGGGICVAGNIGLEIGNVSVDKNTATNGGGICLLNGATMDFGQGFIRENKAVKSSDMSAITAYQKSVTEVNGIGGGIYLDSNTQLTFSVQNELGMYDNLADNAADDIFANGNGTNIHLPAVEEMKLTGFDIAGKPYWVEDYITNDAQYAEGTYIYKGNEPARRYRTALQMMSETDIIYEIDDDYLTNISGKYLCLALGHDVVYVTIQKHGLKNGESSIFVIENVTPGVTDTEKRTLLLTGTDESGTAVEKKVALSTGIWKVTETPWSWAYQLTTPAANNHISQSVANGTVFEFMNVKNTDLLHGEAKVENEMK